MITYLNCHKKSLNDSIVITEYRLQWCNTVNALHTQLTQYCSTLSNNNTTTTPILTHTLPTFALHHHYSQVHHAYKNHFCKLRDRTQKLFTFLFILQLCYLWKVVSMDFSRQWSVNVCWYLKALNAASAPLFITDAGSWKALE